MAMLRSRASQPGGSPEIASPVDLVAVVRQLADRLAVEAGGYQVHAWDAGYRAAQEEIARELLLVLADLPPRGPESLPARLGNAGRP